MKYFIFLIAFSLMGCTIVPVTKNFPKATPELMKQCEELKEIEGDKVLISDMLKVIIHNYSLYYECSEKVSGWQQWYNDQKKIFETAK